MIEEKVSIIIPVKAWNKKLEECLAHCERLEYPDYETILLPDEDIKVPFKSVIVVPTGPIGPSEKRDIGIKHSTGSIIAFIDDDAFPAKDWIAKAVIHFKNPEIGGVGGPAVTPENDGLWQKGSGKVFESSLASGKYVYRYLPRGMRYEDDYPTVNFILPKKIIEQIGGFNNLYWPGEDTVLCLKITHELKKKIIYDPGVLVYHHRRQLFREHNKQVGNYGLHRGYFVKKFPQTSMRPGYFVPSLFVAGLVVGAILSFFFSWIRITYLSVIGVYLLMVVVSAAHAGNAKLAVLVFLGIIDTHIVYGVNFIRGLLSKELRR